MSVRSEFVTRLSAERSRLSNMTRAALSADGEQRSKWCTLGALKEARRRIRASCAPIIIIIIIKSERHHNVIV